MSVIFQNYSAVVLKLTVKPTRITMIMAGLPGKNQFKIQSCQFKEKNDQDYHDYGRIAGIIKEKIHGIRRGERRSP